MFDTVAALQRTAADLRSALDRVNAAIMALQRDGSPLRATDAPTTVTYVDPRFADCLSRGVPEGRDTVLGYLAKHHPEMLELIDYDVPEATARDGFWLAHRAHEQAVFCPAPPVLRAKGIMRVRAWTVALLSQRFG
jgi:hypothetical protein